MDYEQIIEAIRQAGGGLSRVTTATGRMSRPRCGMRRAVFPALGRALSPETGEHLAAALPQTYEPLVAEAQFRYLEIMPTDQFWAGSGSRSLGLGAPRPARWRTSWRSSIRCCGRAWRRPRRGAAHVP